MNDGSMFGGLKKYRKKEFWEENPYFTLYTEGAVYRYQIFACHEAENGGDVYKIGYEPGEKYQKLIDSMVCNSLIDTGIHPGRRAGHISKAELIISTSLANTILVQK